MTRNVANDRGAQMMYLAVLPSYRQECINALLQALPDLIIACSDAHLNPSVKTGIRRDQYLPVRMYRLFGKVFVQYGHLVTALRARDLILDLNPRSLTAWALLIFRRGLRKRTLLWGHLYPRAGNASRSRGARETMRAIASGTITYTYAQREAALADRPGSPVWVAPNALYRRADILQPAPFRRRDAVLYVGRLEAEKRVRQIVSAFKASGLWRDGVDLIFVGAGEEEGALREAARAEGIEPAVAFHGWENSVSVLRGLYARAFATVSPGFAGLGLTQSLGFGVPMAIARRSDHSPEVELASEDAVEWFEADRVSSFADALQRLWASRESLPLLQAQERIADQYSAESMANGLIAALRGSAQTELET